MSLTRGVSELKFYKEKVGKSKKMADKGANTDIANKGFNEEMASFMMTMMNWMLQEQSAMNRMESELTLAVQTVIERSTNTRWPVEGQPEYKWCFISTGFAHLMSERG